MRHVKLLDCTLRDGAYLVDKTFGLSVMQGMIEGLESANIDIIEIGFLQDEGFGPGKTVYLNAKQAECVLTHKKKECIYTVLADFSRYSVENLDDYTGKSFDAVRACFFKHEREEVLSFCRKIQEKGYRLFIQPVDIMGYQDEELLELIRSINTLKPYCFSIVDTFGSMYVDDLLRLYSIIHHNLDRHCCLGFHSHNNLQLSSALSQEIVKCSYGQREVVIDASISGLGRGAGNTPTELIAQYLVTKYGYPYDLDAILDTIDRYIPHIQTKCTWGYSTANYIAGSFGAHVNNVSYLRKKNSIDSKAMRHILNRVGVQARKRYDYALLDSVYMEYIGSHIDDDDTIKMLHEIFNGKDVLVVSSGAGAGQTDKLRGFLESRNALAVSINHIPQNIPVDFLYLNNIKRYHILRHTPGFEKIKKIVTSNIECCDAQTVTVNFIRLAKCGWEYMDNSTIMLLRLLDLLNPRSIGIAGMDGYSANERNYEQENMEIIHEDSIQAINEEIEDMLEDYMKTRKGKCRIFFVTDSQFQQAIKHAEQE